jgi:hypothetical protein
MQPAAHDARLCAHLWLARRLLVVPAGGNMKKQGTRKLALGRETLAPLTPEALDAVHGGNITTGGSQLHCVTQPGQKTCLLCIPDTHNQPQ